jgi:hypothetical protein
MSAAYRPVLRGPVLAAWRASRERVPGPSGRAQAAEPVMEKQIHRSVC